VAKKTRKPSRSTKGYRVFLSHSHHDRWIADVLREKIEAAGIAVWLDAVDIPGGGNVKKRVKRGMRKCDECAELISPAALQSQWVLFEMGLAEGIDRWLTPILLHVRPDDVPSPVRDLNPVSINDFDSYLQELARRSARRK
jgi:hypothetical protein